MGPIKYECRPSSVSKLPGLLAHLFNNKWSINQVKLDLYIIPHRKLNFRWTKYLNLKKHTRTLRNRFTYVIISTTAKTKTIKREMA